VGIAYDSPRFKQKIKDTLLTPLQRKMFLPIERIEYQQERADAFHNGPETISIHHVMPVS
jgi:hypothetical protein